MKFFLKLLFFVLLVGVLADESTSFIDTFFKEIKNALNAEALPEGSRQYQYPYRPQNNAISLGVYEALQSIARNDDLECVSRLLCEAAAGGQPGFSGKQIKFDKLSLTNLVSYLKLDTTSSSPLLVFGRAALLGVSNRGDPYSCIINYPKCPKDQSRLLYYLNNHRGGFFQYFDKKHHKPGNYYYQNQYRPGNNYYKYQKQLKQNKIQFESTNSLLDRYKKKASNDIYATKYTHSSLNFPSSESFAKRHRPMVFPDNDGSIDPRILTQPSRQGVRENDFFFSSSTRFPKKLNDFNFFPQKDNILNIPAAVASDRLPFKFNFPDNDRPDVNYSNKYGQRAFFPSS